MPPKAAAKKKVAVPASSNTFALYPTKAINYKENVKLRHFLKQVGKERSWILGISESYVDPKTGEESKLLTKFRRCHSSSGISVQTGIKNKFKWTMINYQGEMDMETNAPDIEFCRARYNTMKTYLQNNWEEIRKGLPRELSIRHAVTKDLFQPQYLGECAYPAFRERTIGGKAEEESKDMDEKADGDDDHNNGGGDDDDDGESALKQVSASRFGDNVDNPHGDDSGDGEAKTFFTINVNIDKKQVQEAAFWGGKPRRLEDYTRKWIPNEKKGKVKDKKTGKLVQAKKPDRGQGAFHCRPWFEFKGMSINLSVADSTKRWRDEVSIIKLSEFEPARTTIDPNAVDDKGGDDDEEDNDEEDSSDKNGGDDHGDGESKVPKRLPPKKSADDHEDGESKAQKRASAKAPKSSTTPIDNSGPPAAGENSKEEDRRAENTGKTGGGEAIGGKKFSQVKKGDPKSTPGGEKGAISQNDDD